MTKPLSGHCAPKDKTSRRGGQLSYFDSFQSLSMTLSEPFDSPRPARLPQGEVLSQSKDE